MSDTPPRTQATAAELRALLRHRLLGAALLAGDGLEIGALHYPQALPPDARADYLDVETAAAARARFPELNGESLVEPRWLGDIVRAALPALTGRRFDFVIMNHVLEHVANPIQALANVWAGINEDGLLAFSVPDKQFTFDRSRPLTTFTHLLAEYYGGVTAVDAQHYVELLESALPDVFADRDRFRAALQQATQRREHAHVWDSHSFRAFWQSCVRLLGFDAHIVFESTAVTNRFEYFAVVRRSRSTEPREQDAMRLLNAVHATRPDLEQALPASARTHAHDLLRWATTAGATIDSDAQVLRPFQTHYHRLLQRNHSARPENGSSAWRAHR